MRRLKSPLSLFSFFSIETKFSMVALIGFVAFFSTIKDSFYTKHIEGVNLLKEGTFLVEAKVDRRKKNTFKSTAMYLYRMTRREPSISGLVGTVGAVTVRTSQNISKDETPLFFVPANFYNFLDFSLIWGRVHNENEGLTNDPKAVVTRGFMEKFSKQGDLSNYIEINQKEIPIIGMIELAKGTVESEGIFLNISAHHLVGDEDKTYINRYVLKENDRDALDKLRKQNSLAQSIDGYQMNSPGYEVLTPEIQRSVERIFVKKSPILVLLTTFTFFICLFFMYKDSKNVFKELEPDLVLRITSNTQKHRVFSFYLFEFCKGYIIFTLLMTLISHLILLFSLHYIIDSVTYKFAWSSLYLALSMPLLVFTLVFSVEISRFRGFSSVLQRL